MQTNKLRKCLIYKRDVSPEMCLRWMLECQNGA